MKIRLLRDTVIDGQSAPAGTVAEVSKQVAEDLFRRKRAVKFVEAMESAESTPPENTAAKPPDATPSVTIASIKGISEGRAAALAEIGFVDIESLSKADDNDVAMIASSISGVGLATVESWVAVAKELHSA